MIDPFGISVLIVNWNSRDALGDCLASLEAQTDGNFETVVVDNGSVDGSVEMVKERFARTVLVETGENLGFAEGCNRGIAVCTQPWVATLNNDAAASPDWICELRAAAKAGGNRVGMLQSRIVFKQRPDQTNSTGVLLFRNGTIVDRAYEKSVRADERVEEIFCVSAGAALYRRAMLEDIRLASGFFDRTFFMYFEDVDLGWRGRLAGWSAVYVPSARVLHAFQGSSSRRGKHFVSLHCRRNRMRALVKNGSLPYALRCVPRFARDLFWSISKEGWKAVPDYVAAIGDAMAQRAAVSRLMRVDRREVERRWVTKGSA